MGQKGSITMTQATVYIASGLENFEAAKQAIALFRANGWVVTYDWTTHGKLTPKEHGYPVMATTALAEINAVKAADVLVVLMPGGRGTHTELGVALGNDIPVVMLTTKPIHDSAIFYHHPLVTPVGSLDDTLAIAEELTCD